VAAFGALLWMLARRLAYPYDLEWMEGGMLCHSLQVLQGKPIYGPPSVDFIPFLYTPLYPTVVAGLSKVFGLGYALGRFVSLLGFFGALLLGYVFARREGGSRATAFAALALPAAAFVPTGAFYDLVRPDSLFLGLTAAAMWIGWWKRDSHAGVAAAAALLVAAFFTKQTASPFMAALGCALLVANRRVVPTYVATLAALGLPSLWWMNHSTQGWFWTYVFKLHQMHDFYPGRAFLGSPVRLILLLGPSLLLIPWALARARTPGLVYAAWVAAAGFASSCLGFGTQWAFTNAFIPGIYFGAVAIGASAGRLVESGPRLRPHVVYALLALSVAIAPGFLLPRLAPIFPRDWAIDRDAPTGYRLADWVPKAEDRQLGDALVEKLRATPGEVLIPFHPYYARLAGKQTHVHRMGVMDIGRAGMGAPRGLAEALTQRQFALVVMDDKIDGTWQFWPNLQAQYQLSSEIQGPRVYAGARTVPRDLYVPRVIDREP
jgi:hypothetical protein